MCHNESGYFALDKTLNKLKESYWFSPDDPICNKLHKCMYKMPIQQKIKGPGFLHSIEKHPVFFQTIHIDQLGPLPRSNRKKYVFAVIDGFTKFTQLCATKDTATGTRVISDRGSAFTSTTFRKFCDEFNIQHILIAVAAPRANGQVESYTLRCSMPYVPG